MEGEGLGDCFISLQTLSCSVSCLGFCGGQMLSVLTQNLVWALHFKDLHYQCRYSQPLWIGFICFRRYLFEISTGCLFDRNSEPLPVSCCHTPKLAPGLSGPVSSLWATYPGRKTQIWWFPTLSAPAPHSTLSASSQHGRCGAEDTEACCWWLGHSHQS